MQADVMLEMFIPWQVFLLSVSAFVLLFKGGCTQSLKAVDASSAESQFTNCIRGWADNRENT